MDVELFNFELPDEAVALRPARPRDSARLLIVGKDGCQDRVIGDLPQLLLPGDLLIFNNTRVLPLQLLARRGAGRVELTLMKHLGPGRWRAFAKPARKLSGGDVLLISEGFAATVEAPHQDGQVVLKFAFSDDVMMEALHRFGTMPLPPYIRKHRAVDDQDAVDYQTVLARHDGAVAAPTAGLHFTEELLHRLSEAEIERGEVTLHVGPGTFLPVTANDTDDHIMHNEWGQIDGPLAAQIRFTKANGGRVVAVGTTSLRLLESAGEEAFSGETDIFITPGYEFRVVDALLTNFHLPRSTLFMLVAAFSGLETMQAAYAYAIRSGYRFYSYGDACLLERPA